MNGQTGHPNAMQITALVRGKTRNYYVYAESGKVRVLLLIPSNKICNNEVLIKTACCSKTVRLVQAALLMLSIRCCLHCVRRLQALPNIFPCHSLSHSISLCTLSIIIINPEEWLILITCTIVTAHVMKLMEMFITNV